MKVTNSQKQGGDPPPQRSTTAIIGRCRAGILLFRSLLLLSAVVVATSSGGCASDDDDKDPRHDSQQISAANYIVYASQNGAIALVADGAATPLVVDTQDFWGVQRVTKDLQTDIERVTTVKPELVEDRIPADANTVVIIGTIGNSKLIDNLIDTGKLDVSDIQDKWETFLIQTIEAPAEGVDSAIVIAGSDRRGTIFGVYDISKRIGVSPWYWWDDVPPVQQNAIYVEQGRFSRGTPRVKYRGFFINDESPSTSVWAHNLFGDAPGTPAVGGLPAHDNPGGLNHEYYERVYELLLRLRGNYLWPAEWGKSLWADDPESASLANDYGVILGSPHDAPMQTSTHEWGWFKQHYNPDIPTGWGTYSWLLWEDELTAMWSDTIERSKDYEMIVCMSMRGENDTVSPDDTEKELTEAELIDLKLEVIEAQQQILAGHGLSDVPQSWDLYKEVQRFWDEGMRPPRGDYRHVL